MTELVRECRFCGGVTVIYVEQDRYVKWRNGGLVQDVWPELSPQGREMLVTGTHAECWNEMFPEEEE